MRPSSFIITALSLFPFALAAQQSNGPFTAQQGFIENKGQMVDQEGSPNTQVLYMSVAPGLKVQLRKTGFSYERYDVIPDDNSPRRKTKAEESGKFRPVSVKAHRVDIDLAGADLSHASSSSPYEDVLNYYTAGTPGQGIISVRHFRKITFAGIYPHIDLEFVLAAEQGNEQAIKYNFIMHPGGNIGDISMHLKGADALALKDDRHLLIGTSLGDIRENIPYSFQPGPAKTNEVQVGYKLENNSIQFVAGSYDRSKDLVIDPTPNLTWGTYYGGTGSDYAYGVAVDGNSNVIASGYTTSTTNIATGGAYQTVIGGGTDGFVVKFNSNGARLWATYYGGTQTDVCARVAVDAANNIDVCGWTASTTNIATVGAHQTAYGGGLYDGFVVKFDAAGVRQWATYYGGSGSDESASGIAVDPASNIIVTGWTQSLNNISTPGSHQPAWGGGSYDDYLVKFNSAGVRQWATYYGGTADEISWWGAAADPAGNVFLAGGTQSANAIATVGAHQTSIGGTYDGFVVKFNAAGVRQWGTYYGGPGTSIPSGVNADGAGNVMMTGQTNSFTAIASVGAHQTSIGGSYDGYLVKFNGAGVRQWGTYYGGSADEGLDDVASDGGGNVYAIGYTASPNNIATASAWQTSFAGGQWDVCVVKFDPAGVRQWGTYYGGPARDPGYAIAVDAAGCAIAAGEAQSTTGIATSGAFQTTLGGGGVDAFVAKFCSVVPLTVTALQTDVSCNGQCTGTASANASGGTTPYTYAWTPSGGTNANATGLCAGTYTITVTDGTSSTASASVTITQPPLLTGSTSPVNATCNGQCNGSSTASASGGVSPYTYAWSNAQTGITATGLCAGTFTVTVTDANGCTATQTTTITEPPPIGIAQSQVNVNCCGSCNGSASAFGTGGTSPYSYSWNTTPVQTTQIATSLCAGNYTVTVTDANGCTSTASYAITQPACMGAAPTFTNVLCNGQCNGTAGANASGGVTPYTYSWNNSQSTQTATGLCPGGYTVTITDANGCTSSGSVTITQPNAVTSTISSTSTTCGNTIGSASVSVSGGTTPYTYAWSNAQTTATATGLAGGTYTVTITDANGCTQTQTVSVNTVSGITLSITSTPASCTGQCTGTASANVTGGATPYSFAWSNGQTAQNITGLCPGTYTVTMTDVNNCTQTQQVTITQPQLPNVLVSNDTTIVIGTSATLNASGGGSYSWSPSTGLNCVSCSNTSATPTATTQYCVTVTDINGCTDSACVTVTVVPPEPPCKMVSLSTLMPTAFSPNGDSKNDRLCVPANPCITSFTLKVYDRWGEQVFETSDLANCWDGIYKGKALNSGVYAYFFEALLVTGETFDQKGNITMVR